VGASSGRDDKACGTRVFRHRVATERTPAGVPEGGRPDTGKNKVHIDFSGADVEAEVKRLVELGAAETGRHSFGDFSWVVLADPDGNAFCIAAGG
jgi:predicted enzyme related to lactoylglutathione lyase